MFAGIKFNKKLLPVIADLTAHLVLAFVLAWFFRWLTGRWLWPVLAVIGGILIDSDHFLDYFLFYGSKFDLKKFLGDRYRSSGKCYNIFHSLEIVALMWVFSGRVYWLVPLATGMTVHLLTDCLFSRGANILYLSMLFRWYHKFSMNEIKLRLGKNIIEENAIKAVFNKSLKLQPTESCLIVTDTDMESIGRAFYEYACRVTPRAKMVVLETTEEHGTEPPEDVAREMLRYDVQILVTEKSLTHTRARRRATAGGARIATMPSITVDIANRCLDIDYDDLRKKSNHLYDILKEASEVRVTTALGTDITFEAGKEEFFGKDGGLYDLPGAFGNLPEGEIAFAPKTCDGIFIVDATFPGFGLLDEPLTFKVTGGMVREIRGSRSDEVLRRLDRVGPKAYRVAELGIGLNPRAKVTGNILEDEKVIGTVHIALGNNLSFGGDNDVPLHLDGVITEPDIYVDSKKLMEKGRFI
jgi:leucyl aminopeptidase (aminopeptidase T)